MKENQRFIIILDRTSQSCFLLMSTFEAAVYCQCVLTTVKSNRARCRACSRRPSHPRTQHPPPYLQRKLFCTHAPDFSSSFSCPRFFLPEALPRAILGLGEINWRSAGRSASVCDYDETRGRMRPYCSTPGVVCSYLATRSSKISFGVRRVGNVRASRRQLSE